jgi:plasmid stabilization system protein ParE
MAYQLIYTKLAAKDLEAIVRHIAKDNQAAAGKVGLELVAIAESLTQMPYRGSRVRGRTDVYKVIRAPYLVLYRIDESRAQIRLQRFWHAKRDDRQLSTE